jgi:FKBP-type peptidyl-prolyl cis-trans isomerase
MANTAVPIQPIKKSALMQLGVGVGLCLLVAAGLAYGTTRTNPMNLCGPKTFLPVAGDAHKPERFASGVIFQQVTAGHGRTPTTNDVVLVAYEGRLKSGKVFDANPQAAMPVASVVPGFSEALQHMQMGGEYRVCIPATLAYGAQGAGNGVIPPNAPISFAVKLLQMKSFDEIKALRAAMQARGAAGQAGAGSGQVGVPQQTPPPVLPH